MFSATFPAEIQNLAREFLREYIWVAVGRVGSVVDNIEQRLVLASSDPLNKLQLVLQALDDTPGRTLVFVQKRKTATWLCEVLNHQYNIAAVEIHGDRTQSQREGALRSFRDGTNRIMVRNGRHLDPHLSFVALRDCSVHI
jgi:ATP-dependent RNA helicase DDX3X